MWDHFKINHHLNLNIECSNHKIKYCDCLQTWIVNFSWFRMLKYQKFEVKYNLCFSIESSSWSPSLKLLKLMLLKCTIPPAGLLLGNTSLCSWDLNKIELSCNVVINLSVWLVINEGNIKNHLFRIECCITL